MQMDATALLLLNVILNIVHQIIHVNQAVLQIRLLVVMIQDAFAHLDQSVLQTFALLVNALQTVVHKQQLAHTWIIVNVLKTQIVHHNCAIKQLVNANQSASTHILYNKALSLMDVSALSMMNVLLTSVMQILAFHHVHIKILTLF